MAAPGFTGKPVVRAFAGELRWAAERASPSYQVLNACRAWRFLDEDVLCSKTAGGEWALQRVRDAATRNQLHEFFRSLPADRFPALVALGQHVWLDNRDERFTAGLDMLVSGLEQRATR